MHKQANEIWADRYDRQIRFAPIGTKGQACLAKAQALVIGCGALGASLAQHLTRAGVGKARGKGENQQRRNFEHDQSMSFVHQKKTVRLSAKVAMKKVEKKHMKAGHRWIVLLTDAVGDLEDEEEKEKEIQGIYTS